jgi:hypothetical protein
MWRWTGTSGGLSWARQWTFGHNDGQGISWLAERLLASQQGLIRMDLKYTELFKKKYKLSKIYFTETTDAKFTFCVRMERKSLKALIWISRQVRTQ